MKLSKLHTWEVKSVGAALISAVMEARRGQKEAGIENPLRDFVGKQIAWRTVGFDVSLEGYPLRRGVFCSRGTPYPVGRHQ